MARQSIEIRGDTVEAKFNCVGVILRELRANLVIQRTPTPISVLSYTHAPLEDGLISSHLMIAGGHICRIGVRVRKFTSDTVVITCSIVDHKTGDVSQRFITIEDEFSITDDSIQVQKGDLVTFFISDLNAEDISISFLYNMSAKSLIEVGAF